MNQQLTQRIQKFLNTPAPRRDLAEGAMCILKLSNNQILYRKLMQNLPRMGKYIEKYLTERLNYRLQKVTHMQVEQMRRKVARIEVSHFQFQEQNVAKEFKKGKRADHDGLPESIQAMYVENKSIMQRMRACHAELRVAARRNAKQSCIDSDMYPFLKELIELDQRYRENWKKYDQYGNVAAQSKQHHEEAVKASKAALGYINLCLNKYLKKPTDRLRQTLASKYALVIDPDPALTKKLKQAGVI